MRRCQFGCAIILFCRHHFWWSKSHWIYCLLLLIKKMSQRWFRVLLCFSTAPLQNTQNPVTLRGDALELGRAFFYLITTWHFPVPQCSLNRFRDGRSQLLMLSGKNTAQTPWHLCTRSCSRYCAHKKLHHQSTKTLTRTFNGILSLALRIKTLFWEGSFKCDFKHNLKWT